MLIEYKATRFRRRVSREAGLFLTRSGVAREIPREKPREAPKNVTNYERRDMRPAQPGDDLQAMRREYQTKVGKRAYHGWDADEIRKRMDQ